MHLGHELKQVVKRMIPSWSGLLWFECEGQALNARSGRRAVNRWEGEETMVQLQEHPDEHWGSLIDRYATQAFAAIRAAGFAPKRAAIAGMYTVATPLLDVVGGDTIDPGELLVIMAYRPPTDDAP